MRGWESFLKADGWTSEYESVDKFLRHYSRKVRSEKTRENACLAVKGLCEFAGEDPDTLTKLSPKSAAKAVQDYVDALANKGYSIRYVNVSLAYLKTFFKVNGYKGARALEVERHYQPSTYRKRSEYIPTSAEIYDMAMASGSTRNKVLVLALYTSGLRNSTLRALLHRDVEEEMERDLEVVRVPVYPEMKTVDAGACKGKIPYYSFISKEAVEALRHYLDERSQMYGEIQGDEPLFASDSKSISAKRRRGTPVMKKSLETLVKRAAKKAGVNEWRAVYPHCLRKAFESALRNAGLNVKDQEFLMGHILPGTQDVYYDRTKVESLRGKYRQIIFFPERSYSDEDHRKRQVLDTVRILGYSEDRIKRVAEALAKYERVDDALEEIKKLSVEPSRAQRDMNENYSRGAESKLGDEQNQAKHVVRIIRGEDRLLQFLNEHWDLIRELSDDRFIMKKSFD